MINLNYYLSTLHPGQWWGWRDVSLGEIYENVIVYNKSLKLPSKADCEKGIKELQEKYNQGIQQEKKRLAYQTESDPLFFKYQSGEIDKQEWLDKREEIKNRFL